MLRWFTDNWHTLLPEPWLAAVMATAAVICGGIVGYERESKQKPVGFRTLALVSLGAAVFTMISVSLQNTPPIAAQVVSGIGFLGAGVILRGQYGITGLTSPATIWTMAAVGMAVGVGYVGAAILLSGFMLGALNVASLFESRYIGPCQRRTAVIIFDRCGGKSLVKIEEVLDEYRVNAPDRMTLSVAEDGRREQMRLRYCFVHRHHHEFLARIADLSEVQEIHRDPPEMPNQT